MWGVSWIYIYEDTYTYVYTHYYYSQPNYIYTVDHRMYIRRITVYIYVCTREYESGSAMWGVSWKYIYVENYAYVYTHYSQPRYIYTVDHRKYIRRITVYIYARARKYESECDVRSVLNVYICWYLHIRIYTLFIAEMHQQSMHS